MEKTPGSQTRLDAADRAALGAMPPSIWALGLGSMFMDTSSELVHSLLPVFMASVLGASMVTIGFVEGVAEATAAITKVFSGAISDALGKRKLLVVCGYGLGAVTKPVFPLATSIGWVFTARFIDRIGGVVIGRRLGSREVTNTIGAAGHVVRRGGTVCARYTPPNRS